MEVTLANILGVDAPIVIILAIIVLVGGPRIPKIARGLGQAKKEFEKGTKDEIKDDDVKTDEPDDKPKA